MDNPKDDNSAINEKLWRAWVEKGKQREKATARKVKVFAGVALIILSLGVGFYVLAVR